jgi:hypothetical protein
MDDTFSYCSLPPVPPREFVEVTSRDEGETAVMMW